MKTIFCSKNKSIYFYPVLVFIVCGTTSLLNTLLQTDVWFGNENKMEKGLLTKNIPKPIATCL